MNIEIRIGDVFVTDEAECFEVTNLTPLRIAVRMIESSFDPTTGVVVPQRGSYVPCPHFTAYQNAGGKAGGKLCKPDVLDSVVRIAITDGINARLLDGTRQL